MSLAEKLEFESDTVTVGAPEKRVSDVFVERLRNLAPIDIDAGLDLAFREIDTWLRDGRFELCNEVLKRIDVGAFHEDLLVGLLTITFSAKTELSARERLFQRTSHVLRLRIGADAAHRSIAGLE